MGLCCFPINCGNRSVSHQTDLGLAVLLAKLRVIFCMELGVLSIYAQKLGARRSLDPSGFTVHVADQPCSASLDFCGVTIFIATPSGGSSMDSGCLLVDI
eukprot:TRINITY_DN17965_c0_g2_i1.p2 TRINITY_DN17965_c0_g2~~TRINITY_DN17965_c0_g2_i1.p2  ORF type:complete len:100 (+),score=17.74 TRINITY_DN17965_c0_g2_i1:113-412(+)